MLKTLYGKLAAALVLLLLTVGLLYAAFTLYSTKLFFQEVNQRFNRDLASQLLMEQRLVKGDVIDQAAVRAILDRYMHINPAIEIYLLDAEGNILAYDAPEEKIKRRRVDLAPIYRFLASEEALPILGDDPRHPTRRKTFSVAPWPLDGPPRQYLYAVLGGEDYDNVQTLLHGSYFLQVSTSAVAASVAFGLLAGLFIFNLLTRRLRLLARVMDVFRGSDFREYHAYAADGGGKRGDEIDRLGDTFDEMARRIIDQMRALEEKDSLRRNLVANVSHDLRTPLASLQGYLETLLVKEHQFSDDQRRQYLAVAFKHSERLTRLVSELFELSKLEANETRPHKEPTALGELLQDVAQKFRLRAEQVGIRLETHIPHHLSFVSVDVALMERVLDNLLENAITHTPQSGAVRLGVEPMGDMIRITVTNSGSTIRPEDMPHLFERFYQAPERRGGGAGLGLAIVRRILELHDSPISVNSSPEIGTSFSFVLPVWRS